MPGIEALPDGLGTNIHFTDPKPGEMKMLAEGGFRWLRMDFVWERIERKKGVYDFSPYDRLLAAAEPHGLRFLFILDYSNKLYESERSVRTKEGRQAFARWAAAAVTRYKGRGILWEMWNEPNLKGFWGPTGTAEDYILLAKAVGEAIAKAAPEEVYIGPATSGIPLGYLEECFRAGLLAQWRAVSVHPYRQQPPETAAKDYRRLRALIRRYAPKGKHVPILSGEWGYSSVWGSMDEDKQGRYLPRQWLTNLANDVRLSIWYDWHDDGRDEKEAEHHFGTVRHAVHAGRDPVYDPKPAYLAARALTGLLKGFRYSKRLAVGGEDAHVLLLAKGDEVRLAAWTTSREPQPVTIPASPGRFRVVGHTGELHKSVVAGPKGLPVTLAPAPVYLVPAKPNALLRVAAAWERAPLEIHARGPGEAKLSLSAGNPLEVPVRLSTGGGKAVEVSPGGRVSLGGGLAVERTDRPQVRRLRLGVVGAAAEPAELAQWTCVFATNPLDVQIHPLAGAKLHVTVRNPSGEPLRGSLKLSGPGQAAERTAPLALKRGQTHQRVAFAVDEPAGGSYTVGLAITGDDGRAQLPARRVRHAVVDDFARYAPAALAKAYRLIGDGDAKVASTQSLAAGEPPAGPPVPGAACLRIRYDLAAGWKFIRLAPQAGAARKIAGRPKRLLLWLHGDGSGHSPRLRFRDATGQTFQPTGEPIRWKGWRCISLSMDGRGAGRWGGAGDGVVHYPIQWDTLLLIDKPRDEPGRGEVYVASPTLEY